MLTALSFFGIASARPLSNMETMAQELRAAHAKTDAVLADTPWKQDALAKLEIAASTQVCIKDGQCYAGSNAATDCCAGHVIDDPVHCTEGLTCGACKTAAGFVVNQLVKKGCAAIIPEGVTACELLGFGPEDPFADICALIIGSSCIPISNLINRGINNPTAICQKINYCTNGGGTGRIFGTKCGCVQKGYCTANDDGCCSGSATRGFNHCLPIGLKICN